MWSKLKASWLAFYYRRCSVYPPVWWWPVIRIFGGSEGSESRICYMTRTVLCPKTRWGQLYLHVFHREDFDRDPHDHPFKFWTLPLNQGYTEEVYSRDRECFSRVRVPHFKWSARAAEHCHRIVEADRGWPLVTLVWRGATERPWGFWCHTLEQVKLSATDPTRYFVPWMRYIFHGDNSNIPGQDNVCPGVPSEYRKPRSL